MNQVSEYLQRELGIGITTQQKVLASVLIIVLVIVLRQILISVMIRRGLSTQTVYQWRKISGRVAFATAVVILGATWLESLRSLGTFLGLFSAGVAIALKDLLTNLAGWVFISWRRPFQVGDRIFIDTVAGDVIDLRLFQFTLLEIGNWVAADQSTGRMVHVPNGKVFTEHLANYTAGFNFLWHEIPVMITFESDWQKAEELLNNIAEEHLSPLASDARNEIDRASYKYMINFKALTPRVYVSVEDSGVVLTIRYLVRPRNRRGTEETIWRAILEAFAQHDNIDFAYPTRRIYYNATEGKPGTRPPDMQGMSPSEQHIRAEKTSGNNPPSTQNHTNE